MGGKRKAFREGDDEGTVHDIRFGQLDFGHDGWKGGSGGAGAAVVAQKGGGGGAGAGRWKGGTGLSSAGNGSADCGQAAMRLKKAIIRKLLVKQPKTRVTRAALLDPWFAAVRSAHTERTASVRWGDEDYSLSKVLAPPAPRRLLVPTGASASASNNSMKSATAATSPAPASKALLLSPHPAGANTRGGGGALKRPGSSPRPNISPRGVRFQQGNDDSTGARQTGTRHGGCAAEADGQQRQVDHFRVCGGGGS